MALSDDQINRWEKSSSLIRNIIIVLAALIPAIIFISDKYKPPVNAELTTLETRTSRIAFLDREILKQCVNEPDKNRKLSDILSNLGRLDLISHITVSNVSAANVDLIVKLRNKSIDDLLELPEKKWGQLPKNHFILVEAYTSCAIDEQDLKVGNKGRLNIDDTGSIHIKDFPSECRLYIETASARSYTLPIEIYADNKKIGITSTQQISGKLGNFAANIQRLGVFGYTLLVLPVAILMLLAIYLVVRIGREDRKEAKEIEPQA
jgi:hypothetical protein